MTTPRKPRSAREEWQGLDEPSRRRVTDALGAHARRCADLAAMGDSLQKDWLADGTAYDVAARLLREAGRPTRRKP